jgi:intracellular proteinase inhibitor BsuPI
MKRRILASLFFAGALAWACGPRSGTSSARVAAASTTPALQTISLARRSDPARSVIKSANASIIREAVKLDARLDVQVHTHTVQFALEVKNVGRKHAEISFPNGQTYDFMVLDSTGTEIWRWGVGRLFTQSVRNKALGKGSAMHVEESWSPASMTGRYTVVAILRSTNYPVEQRVEFELPSSVNLATTR